MPDIPSSLRISNAANRPGPDNAPDMRGIALRIKVSAIEQHDLLATNYHVSHARNARQFVRFAVATAGGTVSRLVGIAGLVFSEGPSETIRMLRNVAAARRKIKSVALETYWSRGAMLWGPNAGGALPVAPGRGCPARRPEIRQPDPEGLSKEAAARLAAGPIQFELCIQRFVDLKAHADRGYFDRMDARSCADREGRNADNSAAGRQSRRRRATMFRVINALAFNPWNTTDEFRPLGNLNRARKDVYDASAAHRLQMRWRESRHCAIACSAAMARAAFKLINRRFEWYRLPLWAAC